MTHRTRPGRRESCMFDSCLSTVRVEASAMDEEYGQAVGPDSSILHLRCLMDVDPGLYRMLLGLTGDVTPVVQVLPPAALVADVSGSVRFFDRDPADVAPMIRTRAPALYGLPVTIGVGPN
ncbi:hypothetical protein ACIA8E_32475 [Streptomyces sp. NPDC051664]|uniref:hypothetical protein n=1 Tax=Streptomyces sp. NPDC051664 TaxID=3365668 RepID=UPI0037AB5F36